MSWFKLIVLAALVGALLIAVRGRGEVWHSLSDQDRGTGAWLG